MLDGLSEPRGTLMTFIVRLLLAS
ncbi:MAG: hypothetical protein LZF62_140066 [Nitrospira sp.]|nr:MAG: hypothetical protein LZF62_140066 [Nitrospira sp.]